MRKKKLDKRFLKCFISRADIVSTLSALISVLRKQIAGKTITNMKNDSKIERVDDTQAPKEKIPIENLIEYRKKNLTYEEIALLTGLCRQTVSKLIQEADLEGYENYTKNKAATLEYEQWQLLKTLTPAKREKSTYYQAIGSATYLDNMVRTERGQATEIIDHRIMVFDLNKAIEQLRQEQGIDTIDVDNSVDIPVHKCPNGG